MRSGYFNIMLLLFGLMSCLGCKMQKLESTEQIIKISNMDQDNKGKIEPIEEGNDDSNLQNKNYNSMTENEKYYYYNSFGQKVQISDPGNILVVVVSRAVGKNEITEKIETLGLKVLKQVRVSEESGMDFLFVEGKIVPLNQFKDYRLLEVRKIKGVQAAGFQLNPLDEQNPFGFYSSVITISISDSRIDNILVSTLKNLELKIQASKTIGANKFLFVQCSEDKGTLYINECIRELAKLKYVKEVAPEIFGLISN